MTFCRNCPLRPDEHADELTPPERYDRLKMLAASSVPVPCHFYIDPDDATKALQDGRDWRFDTRLTVPCVGTVCPETARVK